VWSIGKRTVHLVLLIVLLFTTLSTTGWAKQSKLFVEELSAWSEGGEVRLQLVLDKPYDEVELVFSQDEQTEKLSYRDESRISATVAAVSNTPVYVLIRAFESKKLATSALYRFRPVETSERENLSVEKAGWERRPPKEKGLLTLDSLMLSDASDPSRLKRQADAYVQKARTDKKPKESYAKSAPATYEVEPNDIAEKADWLFSGKDAYGKIGKSGDTDYWKMKATGEGTLKFWLGEIPDGQDYDLTVYDEQGQELGKSEKKGSMDELVEGIATEKNAWYYVVVRGSGNSFHNKNYYHLKAEFLQRDMEVKPDLYEPNNQISDAYRIDQTGEVEGSIHSHIDADFYRFDITLASTIALSLSNIPQGMDLDLYLYDKEHRLVAKSEKAKHAAESIEYNGDPGSYYVKVAAGHTSAIMDHAYKLEVRTNTIPVILIPGIGGSRLSARENGQVSEAWLNLEDIIWRPGDGKHRENLALRPDKPGSSKVVPVNKKIEIFPEQEDGGFRAIEYLSYVDKEIVKQQAEQYFSMVQHLQRIGYQKHKTLFALPYDWRYSNVDNAIHLKKKIDAALLQSQARQVQLVAHSMGGILVKETLLANPSYQSKTRRIVYLGTPFIGSPRAYQAIKFGYDFSIPLFNEGTGQLISQFSPAVYELLPSKEYVSRQSYLYTVEETRYRPLTYNEILKDERFRLQYQPLVRLSDKQHAKWDSRTINVPQYGIIGQGQTTLSGYTYNPHFMHMYPLFDQAQGDGTVPFVSADYGQKDFKQKYYVSEEHSKLMRNPHVIQQVSHLLLGMEEVQQGLSQTPIKSGGYHYYIIQAENGEFPHVSLFKSGRKVILRPDSDTQNDGLRLEFHGNVIVVHVTDDEKVRFQVMERSDMYKRNRIYVQEFSSRKASAGSKEYELIGDKLIER
jgi:pimeloyl-ACP methyl ester carboxylesterase